MASPRLFLIPLLLALAGCGAGGTGGGTSLPSTAASPADTPSPPATVAPPRPTADPGSPAATQAATVAPAGNLGPCSALKLTLASDKPAYKVGETVHLTATLTNAGTVTCTFQAGAQRGFTVTGGATAVWRSGCSSTAEGHTATEPCPQFLALMPIKAGQVLTRTQDWSQQADGTDAQVAAGSYQVAETWGGSSASATITIS